MNNLWQPTKHDTAAISAGERKVRLAQLRPSLRECPCPYCQRDVYYYEDRHKYMTLTGSDHKCKAMP